MHKWRSLREKLALKKIYPAPSEKVMYRYSYEDILIDFIPFEETLLAQLIKLAEARFLKKPIL